MADGKYGIRWVTPAANITKNNKTRREKYLSLEILL